jgi:hypothetical protein
LRNWFLTIVEYFESLFEILKWQNLASNIKTITVSEATTSTCSADCWDFFPNGIGEYAGKALYYEKSETTQVISF